MLNHRIEEAALNAWPALQQTFYDGWVLRFSQGYTKRANSVTPLYNGSLPLAEKIAYCEARYATQSLPPVFRLTSFTSPPELDPLLDTRGYRTLDPTLVEYNDLAQYTPPAFPAAEVRAETLSSWLVLFSQINDTPLAEHAVHRAILGHITARPLFMSMRESGDLVACGLAVVEGRFCGLFDMVTVEAARNQGYGTALVAHLLNWGREQGARHAYLQVERANTVARHVYETKFDFNEAYTYWYRVPGTFVM